MYNYLERILALSFSLLSFFPSSLFILCLFMSAPWHQNKLKLKEICTQTLSDLGS